MARWSWMVLLLLTSLIIAGCPSILLTDADRDLMRRAVAASEKVQAAPVAEKDVGNPAPDAAIDPLKQLTQRSEDAAKRAEVAARKSEAAAGRAENATVRAEQDANKALQDVLKFLRDLGQ